MDDSHEYLLSLAAQIVSAHLRHHAMAAEALPDLIRDVYRTLADVETRLPAVKRSALSSPVRRAAQAEPSVARDHLVCLECGLTVKMLKRHLASAHGLTPDDYRAKWSLPAGYPMVAEEHAEVRSALAKENGLGTRKRGKRGPGQARG